MLLQTCLGLAAALGCAAWGVVTAKPSAQCLVSRQYLCQAALLGVGQYTTRYAVVARVLEPRCGSRGKVVWSRERERKRQREWRIAWLRSVLRCRGVCFGLSETTLRTDPPWMENIGLLMKIEGILEERETKYNFVGSFKRFEESVTPRPFCTVV